MYVTMDVMDTKLASPFTLLKHAWTLAIARPSIISYLALGALPQLFSLALSAILAYVSGIPDIQTTASSMLTNSGGWGVTGLIVLVLGGLVVVSLVSAWYTALLYTVYQATEAGNLSRLTTYIKPAKQVTIHLLTTYITVGLFASLGFLLLIIPGIIVAVRYMFAPMIAAVEDRTVKPIEESKRLVKGRFWKLAGRSILFVLCYNVPLSIFQAIHPWLGSVWAISLPIFGLYFYLVYSDFKRTTSVSS